MNLRRIAIAALAEDASPDGAAPSAPSTPTDLEKHDARFHPDGYKEGESCKYREARAKMDKADNLSDFDRLWKPREAERSEERDYFRAAQDRAKAEYDAIIAQYKGTPQWMKAPNGQPTHLNERQWVQVRTPSFKRWFGDWENDPKHASKVIDENGEPKVVYHGTKEAFFYEFDTNEGWKNKNNSPGAFFAGTRAASESYASREDDILFPEDVDESMVRENQGINEGFCIEDKNGDWVKLNGYPEFFDTEEELRETYDLDEGEKVVKVYKTDYNDQDVFLSVEDLVEDERKHNFEAYIDDKGGIYECFLNIRDPYDLDAHEQNWDSIETSWHLEEDADGDERYFNSREEAEKYCKDNDIDVDQIIAYKDTTNDIAREAMDMECDGAIIRNIQDSGSTGREYWDSFDDFIVFKSANIKSATHNQGSYIGWRGDVRDEAVDKKAFMEYLASPSR